MTTMKHANPGLERRFLIALAISALVFLAELIGAWWTGSLALLSDSAHVFLDIMALGLSYVALRLSNLPPDDRHTYGYHRLEVFAALVNGITLAGVAIGIFVEAYHRLLAPEPVKSVELLVIAVIGLIANLFVAFLFGTHGHEHEHEHEHHGPEAEDLNVRSAFLHVIGDAVSSVGVIIAALVIWRTGWTLADPIVSVVIGLLIIASSWRVTKSSLHILVEGTPEGFHLADVVQAMGSAPGVIDVHDLHVWSLCSGNTALSAHVVIADQPLTQAQALMAELKHRLLTGFGIQHTTIQFECSSCGQGTVVCVNGSSSRGTVPVHS